MDTFKQVDIYRTELKDRFPLCHRLSFQERDSKMVMCVDGLSGGSTLEKDT